jgi:drug/metabolite transporter (DMT)-like permease
MLSTAGLACIAWNSLRGSSPGSLTGLLCALGALFSWTVYAVQNSRALARLDHVTSHEWSLLTGVVTGAESLLLAVPAFLFAHGGHSGEDWLYFGSIVTTVAICASILGNAFWNRASRLLPLTMTGQMILFETLFALLYAFIWERRLPAPAEVAAIALLVAGVLSCAAAHRAPPHPPA